jgi:transient receptor potential cation channel subfamily C
MSIYSGFIWEETKELYKEGLRKYLNDLWNVIDVGRNLLYLVTFVLRVYAYIEQNKEISSNQAMAYLPRELWNPYDAQLISEGLCAAANVLRSAMSPSYTLVQM